MLTISGLNWKTIFVVFVQALIRNILDHFKLVKDVTIIMNTDDSKKTGNLPLLYL
jgi:hypothetical protein